MIYLALLLLWGFFKDCLQRIQVTRVPMAKFIWGIWNPIEEEMLPKF